MKRQFEEWKRAADNDAKARGYRIVDYDLYDRYIERLLIKYFLGLFIVAIIVLLALAV